MSKNDNKVMACSAVNQGQNLSSYVDTELINLEDLSIHPPMNEYSCMDTELIQILEYPRMNIHV